VFYNVLRDTLVADTVEDASYIAFRTGVRRRVVSMDGKLIEMSGVMSGGGKPRRGGMAAKFKNEISSEELIQLSKQKNRKGAELEQLQQQVKHFDMILNELQKDEQESKSRYK
jgi:structural maintenance of chromosome 4